MEAAALSSRDAQETAPGRARHPRLFPSVPLPSPSHGGQRASPSLLSEPRPKTLPAALSCARSCTWVRLRCTRSPPCLAPLVLQPHLPGKTEPGASDWSLPPASAHARTLPPVTHGARQRMLGSPTPSPGIPSGGYTADFCLLAGAEQHGMCSPPSGSRPFPSSST